MVQPDAVDGPGSDAPRGAMRPTLLLLVFAAFLLIIGVTASGQAALITADQQQAILRTTVGSDATAIRTYVGLIGLTPGDLAAGGMTADRGAALQRGLSLLVEDSDLLHVALLRPDGTVLATDDGTGIGSRATATDGLQQALALGQAQAAVTTPAAAGALAPLATTSVVREYLPVIAGGRVQAVVAVWRDAAPILAELDADRFRAVAVTLSAALVCALLLGFIFRRAQQRLSRQARQLLEAARRDPLTGLPNHGALVERLERRLEAARAAGGAASVALLDLDNFRALNDTYGHPAGDHVLQTVATLLVTQVPAGSLVGRYGPDEFLIVAPAHDASLLEPAMEEVRTALAELSLRFAGSERLPVTVSGGIAFWPRDGASVTSLLAVAATVLDEARSSGGDALRVADARPDDEAAARAFDVFQGLVIAVDTKDRYTRRHSEDVARYADFLARQLDLDVASRRAIHTAGLLHDVGKIGIPDAILRKPGRLTDDEFAIVRQHVTLGDRILHDLPDLELVRAGVRHHHERWDGHGYAHALRGQDIPFVARLLAVGDAFSAMTTTRPYRKALSIEEALRRLEDAAGTQLDEDLVRTFVAAMRTASDAPLGEPARTGPVATRLWTPDAVDIEAQVA